MGTRRPVRTTFDTVSNVSMSDHNKLQPGGKISRDPSPRPALTAQTDRGREGSREDEWRRDRNADRRRDKEQRYKEPIEPPRDRYYDRDRGPKTWDGERDRREENRNMRPLSNIEKENDKEGDRGVRKGDTFPRSARNHGPNILAEVMEAEREERRRTKEDRERVRDRERDRDRARDRPKDRDDHRSKSKDTARGTRDERDRDRYREFEDRRRDGGDPRDKYGTRKANEKHRGPREPPRMSSPERRRDREMYWDKAERREGRRDTRSEGEIDERQRKKERVRNKEEMNYQHSRSEGETRNRTDRERREYRDQERYREREDRHRNRDDRYRDSRERDMERPRRSEDDKRREDRYRDRHYDETRRKDRPREQDSQRQPRPTPRAPPRVPPRGVPRPQSSGEWSSDMDGEAKAQTETKKERKMWLDPQRDPTGREDSENRKDTRMVEGEETREMNVDGDLEWSRRESCPGDSEENTEDSEEGSDVGWAREKERIVSGGDGFVTVSSGDEEEREDDFKDCVEYWEEERDTEDTVDEEELSDEPGRSTPQKFVFCVVGQTSGQSQVDDRTAKGFPSVQNDKIEHEYDEVREFVEMPTSGDQTAMDGVKIRSNSCHDFGTIKRDSQTERLLLQWREKTQNDEEPQRLSPIPSNPYANVPVQVPYEHIQSTLERRHSGAMTPEEEEAIRIRMSGAWSMSEETKRHSQAPHLKWATNVVREILGQSDESLENPQNEVGEAKVQNEEIPQTKTEDGNSEEELEEDDDDEEELERLRDDEDGVRSKSWGELDLRSVLDTLGKRKRNSKFFNAAQLYQQYSEAAQNFEILRQARSDVVSICEGSSPASSPPPARRPLPPLPLVPPHPHSLSNHGSVTSVQSLPLPSPPRGERRASSPHLSISIGKGSSLWRDLPAVRNSTELQALTEDKRKLQEVRFEVVTSEASYCRSLDIVVDHFVKSKQLGALLTTQDRNWLFSRLSDVRAISHSFLSKLEEKVDSDIVHFTVCDVIARHCPRFKMVYVPYLTNQSYQDATYQRLMNENQGFRQIVEKLERSPVCQRLPLRSFLVLPFQRITRIKLLVQNIVKRTTPKTNEATQAIKALKLLEKLIQEGNDSITQMKSIESLVSLSARVDFECKTLPLISQSRRLVREGKVTELMDFSLKETERSLYLHLFNDYLLLSQQKEGGRFTVIDTSPVSELRTENCRVKLATLQKNLFRLHMAHKSLLLRTDTQSDKLRWISAMSRPHPEVDFSAAQDFPQMQCIRAIVAQQPDELSLEKADIILVHQQSSDHWVEGTRLSDRQRGWVPESHLETISNSEIRKRNLSDALKLTTATAQV